VRPDELSDLRSKYRCLSPPLPHCAKKLEIGRPRPAVSRGRQRGLLLLRSTSSTISAPEQFLRGNLRKPNCRRCHGAKQTPNVFGFTCEIFGTGLRTPAHRPRGNNAITAPEARSDAKKGRENIAREPPFSELPGNLSISTLSPGEDVHGAKVTRAVAAFRLGVQHDPSPNTSRGKSPFVSRRGAPKAINLIRVALGLRRGIQYFSLDSENAQ